MDTCDIFLTAGGSAAGGFLGVMVFFLLRLFIQWMQSRPSKIRTYLCANEQNQGQSEEDAGELQHHHGTRISAVDDLRRLGIDHPIWEWTRDSVGRGEGDSVIFGPYSTDFAEPGLYSVAFVVRGVGFTRPAEIINDVLLLELDVNKTTTQLTATGETHNLQNKIARRFIRVSELAQGDWQEFEIRFYSDGQGLWEYRIFAYDGSSSNNRVDNVTRFGTEIRILFDKIIIRKINKINLPMV